MNNINISNIFTTTNYKNSELSVHDLTYNLINKNKKLTDEYIINRIKYTKTNDKKKLKDYYEKKYSECLIKIDNAIDIKITDIFFMVPDYNYTCKYYSSLDCLKYIENKLREKNFNTLIINNITIFISWNNIKIKKKN